MGPLLGHGILAAVPTAAVEQPATFEGLPSKAEVNAALPAWVFERRLARSALHAAFSVTLTAGTGLAALLFLPLTWAWFPIWILYAVVCGTFATGVWVIAHECGHRAFCNGTRLQDALGFVLHSSLLVPYFSWQRSHALHHAKTNHLDDGETHVPHRIDTAQGQRALQVQERLGPSLNGAVMGLGRLLIGWPMYLIAGATGGGTRGVTNHFWPSAPFSNSLFPKRLHNKVRFSALGVVAVLGLLAWWAVAAGSVVPVLAVYVGPYLICNAWLVGYTWLQHTDVDVPHYEGDDWSFVRGAFCSIDRPYPRMIDVLHHSIGSTHVAHHLESRIPHYNAGAATEAIAETWPHLYRYDPTPIPQALWRVSRGCHVVAPSDDGWKFTTSV